MMRLIAILILFLLLAVPVTPLAAAAQPPDNMRRIAIMNANAENDSEGQARIAAFRRGLQELGWTEGQIYGSSTVGAPATLLAREHSRGSW